MLQLCRVSKFSVLDLDLESDFDLAFDAFSQDTYQSLVFIDLQDIVSS